MIVELAGGDVVEACVMRHAKGRTTLCVSSQVGCKMGCTFCATGTLGELGNLSAGEICEQLAHASRGDAVRNVVFMGMGEPLNNYRNVIDAIEAMTSDKGFGLSPAKITVSTVGVIPRMRTLRRDAPGTRLALSLHAPNQALRQIGGFNGDFG
jgi:adenine C2-methylase RlmN of 23S rRNA A2503 and tRNA A37